MAAHWLVFVLANGWAKSAHKLKMTLLLFLPYIFLCLGRIRVHGTGTCYFVQRTHKTVLNSSATQTTYAIKSLLSYYENCFKERNNYIFHCAVVIVQSVQTNNNCRINSKDVRAILSFQKPRIFVLPKLSCRTLLLYIGHWHSRHILDHELYRVVSHTISHSFRTTFHYESPYSPLHCSTENMQDPIFTHVLLVFARLFFYKKRLSNHRHSNKNWANNTYYQNTHKYLTTYLTDLPRDFLIDGWCIGIFFFETF